MNLNFIKSFLAIYDYQSITKAAEHLNITQPSLSAGLKNFETQLGKSLFHRAGRVITPTDECHYFALQCREIVERLDAALNNTPQIKVCCPELVMQVLPNIDNVYFIETPAIEYSSLDKLRTGEVDIIVDDIAVTDYSFVSEVIGKQKLAFACRKDHPDIGDELSLEQFVNAEHIMLRLKDKNVGALETRTDESFVRNIVREVSGQSNLLLNARHSNAICIVCESMFALADELGLKVLPPPFELRDYEMKLIYHRRHANSQQHIEVRERIKQVLIDL
ncbi:LysR family transcriptional regulator [Echinimonas agarilytica]|uniref:LysR family transcriptional regulator n=1 Tax=Echinimonas agarilytica TaxID=1215918 RepID=A0AA41W3W0_9GAMM|nr:LysR family transcriptional regulator [Echinimonas agarilytica]MCM2678168.1 LysR family transcriptional regulator [Echinimonas agarilytica]